MENDFFVRKRKVKIGCKYIVWEIGFEVVFEFIMIEGIIFYLI